MSELLSDAYAAGYAVPSFCVWNAETMTAVLRVARDLKSPVILMCGPGEFPLLSPGEMGAVAHALIEGFPVRAALHLDHGDSHDQVQACLAARFTSVMLDFSTRPLDENMAALRQVTDLAHPFGVTVEGEIGVVGRVGDVTSEGGEHSALSDPAEAAAYVEATGVDALAVAIGNAHGLYTRLPRLDFALLERLRDAVPVPLVLHGGSGTPEADLKRAISLGIAKVNVATELITTVRTSLMDQWQAGTNQWTPAAQTVAMKAMAPVVEKWCLVTDAAGKA
jgi:tagatose 1,6-diphosphate aldolase GatY/KbaY